MATKDRYTQFSITVPQFPANEIVTYLESYSIPCTIENNTVTIDKNEVSRAKKILTDTLGPNRAKFEPQKIKKGND